MSAGFDDRGGYNKGSKALMIICVIFIVIMLGTMALRDILSCAMVAQ